MIVYFADRRLSIIGLASSDLKTGVYIGDDNFVDDVESGTTTFSLDVYFDDENRKKAETMADAGNYVLCKYGDKSKFFTIIDTEEDVMSQKISAYLEDGGLDLLNDVAGPFAADRELPLDWYLERWLVETGFEIKIDPLVDTTKQLQLGWESTDTVTNRLISIATAFDTEIDFGFDIQGLTLTHKYVNVYKKRGKDISAKLRLGKEIENLRVKKSVANLATALDVVGGQDTSEVDLTGVGCILIGNEFAFGENGSSGNGWVDSFFNQTNCMGYAIRQPGGDFAAKGGENATYPGKTYAECLTDFMSTTGSQNQTVSTDGPRGYRLALDLSWSKPTGDEAINVTYTLSILAGSTYYFSQFAIGWEVYIGGTRVNYRARAGAAKQGVSKNGRLQLCTGTTSVSQNDNGISVSALIDMATNRVSDGKPVAPGPMNLSGSFKPVKADTDEQKKTIRYVIVGGGVNDITPNRNASGMAAIKSGIDSFITVVREQFPYAKIYLIPLFGTIEGDISDRSKVSKATVTRAEFTEDEWLIYSTLGHIETWTGTSSSRGGAVKKDIFHVTGKSVDGGWTHTAVYMCDNDSGDLHGTCVGHFVNDKDMLLDTWVAYARSKGVYTCEPSIDWFEGDSDSRPEEGPSTNVDGVKSVTRYYRATSSSDTPDAASITSTTIPTLTTTNKYLWCKTVVKYTDTSISDSVGVSLLAVKDAYGTHVRSGSSLFLNNSGYSTAGQYIAKFINGWDGDVDTENGYMNTKYITLEGREYDDGDIYIDGTLLKSRNAVSKWTRFVDNDKAFTNSYHIVRTFSYDTDNQDELLSKAIEELKELREPAITYEADVYDLPRNIGVGDTVDIVDEKGEIFLSSRILQIEHSETRAEDRVTLGDYKRKESGLVQIVQDLSKQFQDQAAKQAFYTWTAYADDTNGTNISLTRLGSSKYLGIATYRVSPEVDLSDPSIFKWTVIEDGDSIILKISSSNGTYFMDKTINTVLTTMVYVNGVLQSNEQISQLGVIYWYKDGTLVGTGNQFEILESQLINEGTYEARLESNGENIEPED